MFGLVDDPERGNIYTEVHGRTILNVSSMYRLGEGWVLRSTPTSYINKCNIYIYIYTECFNVAVSDISGSASCSDSDVDFFGPFERGEASPSPPDEDA